MKASAEQLNELKVDDDVITPMKNVLGTTIDVTLKNNHSWVCPVYALGSILQMGNWYHVHGYIFVT